MSPYEGIDDRPIKTRELTKEEKKKALEEIQKRSLRARAERKPIVVQSIKGPITFY